MTILDVAAFRSFVAACHGRTPFPWQERLARRVIGGDRWPEVIDVPTGLGKTSVLDVAVFALAAQAGNPDRTAPTRTFFVIDRRLVVDDVSRHARTIAAALTAGGGVAGEMADRLRGLTPGGSGEPLEVVTMRGGMTWDWRWLARPDQPAIVVGTVDQFGSRRLFRGYGVGDRLKPLDAGLTGNDALVVIDEAHLSAPLAEMLLAAERSESQVDSHPLRHRPTAVVRMSATAAAVTDRFGVDDDDRDDPVAGARLRTTKPTVLIDLSKVAKKAAPDSGMAAGLVALAQGLTAQHDVHVVGIIVNTVGLARRCMEALAAVDCERLLLIGRCRDHERGLIERLWLDRLRVGRVRISAPRPTIVVATQTIEVGADLDFDALITECAPLDALRQRFGRVNRVAGGPADARSVVAWADGRAGVHLGYGDRPEVTWRWLRTQLDAPPAALTAGALRGWRPDPRDPYLDFGPAAMEALVTGQDTAGLVVDPPASPVLTGPLLDLFARTGPVPVPDQPVAPFLHGIGQGTPEVRIAWRADLGDDAVSAIAAVERTPVTAAETVGVPLWTARRFVAGLGSGELSDLEHDRSADDPPARDPALGTVLRVRGRDTVEQISGANDVRSDDTIVLDVRAGGHDDYGWTGAGAAAGVLPVLDVADLAVSGRRRRALRLDPRVLGPLTGWDAPLMAELLGPLRPVDPEVAPVTAARQVLESIGDALTDAPALTAPALAVLVHALAAGSGLRTIHSDDPRRPVIGVSAVTGTAGVVTGVDVAVTSDDDDTSSLAGRVPLVQHLHAVGARAALVATSLGFAPELVQALRTAGELHDVGKLDRRFQAMLWGGDADMADVAAQPIAKSGMDPRNPAAFWRARSEAKLPDGFRHEALSGAVVADAVRHDALPSGVDADLVLHLVLSHHGHGRPLGRTYVDHDPHQVTWSVGGTSVGAAGSVAVDWEQPARFAQLNQRYGHWGLALLETVLRLADIGCSEDGT